MGGNVTGLFHGDPGQLLAELIGGTTNIVAVGALTVVARYLTSLVTGGHRVSAEAEEAGLDLGSAVVLPAGPVIARDVAA